MANDKTTTMFITYNTSYNKTEVCPSKFSKANRVGGRGWGVSFFFKMFFFQFLSLFSCTVIFECWVSFLHLWWKLGTYGSYESDILVCFSKLREFPTEIGVFVGNIR